VYVLFTERADVPFNWLQADAATPASSQQQACCVSTLLGRAAVMAAVDQADTLVKLPLIIMQIMQIRSFVCADA